MLDFGAVAILTTTRFGEWLLRQMKERGEIPADLARGAQISQSSITAYTTTVTVPSYGNAAKIARHYGMDLEDVLAVVQGRDTDVPASEDVVIPEVREVLARMTPEEQKLYALRAVRLAEDLLREARGGKQ